MQDHTKRIEHAELIQKLRSAGYGWMVEALLNDTKVYTRKGRLNKSALCRATEKKMIQVQRALEECRSLLQ